MNRSETTAAKHDHPGPQAPVGRRPPSAKVKGSRLMIGFAVVGLALSAHACSNQPNGGPAGTPDPNKPTGDETVTDPAGTDPTGSEADPARAEYDKNCPNQCCTEWERYKDDKCTGTCTNCTCTEMSWKCSAECYKPGADCVINNVGADGTPGGNQTLCKGVGCAPEDDTSVQLACNGTECEEVAPPAPVCPETPQQKVTEHLYIWIANSIDGTVSKLVTATGVEVARYLTGPDGQADPSRTTVSLDGDVVIANRSRDANLASAIRIHADVATCPDVNGNGQVDTSQGPTDVRPWGEDECVLWVHQFPDGSIPRAAAFDYAACADKCAERSESVWIGLHGANKVVQLNAMTGELLREIDTGAFHPYGMAFDARCQLWVVDAHEEHGDLLKVDTKTGMHAFITGSGCRNYGVAVDNKSRVWTASQSCVSRYDQDAAKWDTINTASKGSRSLKNRGLTYDGAGSMWVADTQFGVHRIDVETMAVLEDLALGGSGEHNFVGTAVDFQGQVWVVDKAGDSAYRIDPNATSQVQSFPTGRGPYTYSDMTGFQITFQKDQWK